MHAHTLPFSASAGKRMIGAAVVVLVVLGIHPAVGQLLTDTWEKIFHALAFGILATGIIAIRPKIGCLQVVVLLGIAALASQYFQLLIQPGGPNFEVGLASVLGGLASLFAWNMRGPACH